jgi:imidazolonepropionase
MRSCDLLVENAAEIVTLRGVTPRRGAALDDPGRLEGAAIAIDGERIVAIDDAAALRREFAPRAVLDAAGGTVLPGFVDAHTHPVFLATREREFDMRLRGATYQEITAAGGGIFSSVRSLRAASDAELAQRVVERCDRFLAGGTTTIEAKSGYGLSFDDEMRSLAILRDVAAAHPLEIHPTFLGAHQMPEEFRERRDAYIDLLIERMLPEVKRRGLATSCDVFCDEGAYDVAESRRILLAAKEQGFDLRVHADELKRLGAAELAVEMHARSADHLCRVDAAAIAALASSQTAAVLLPGTVLSLGLKALPPARALIDAGAAVVIATDFNPGTSYLSSMPLCIALACMMLRMTVSEALAAATINAAWSLGIADRVGSLEPGKQADLVVLDRESHLFLGYELGENPVAAVVKNGRVVMRRRSATV